MTFDTPFEFPAINKVSFFKVFESLHQLARDQDDNVSRFAQQLIDDLEAYHELKDGFDDLTLLDKYKPQIGKIARILFPEALLTNEIKGLTPPFQFKPFYTSTRFANIVKEAGKNFKFQLQGVDKDMFYIAGCTTILRYHFGFPVNVDRPFILEIPHKPSGINRYYRIAFNADLIEIFPTEKAKTISQEDYLQLMDNFHDIKLWKKMFPPNSWIMRGVSIMNLMDVTLDQSISMMTSNLIAKRSDIYNRLTNNIRTLFNIKDLRIGFVALEDGHFLQAHKTGTKSILLDDTEMARCASTLCNYGYKTLIENNQPMVIPDVTKYNRLSQSQMAENLDSQSLGSYIIVPLIHQEKTLGFLEIASPRKYELNRSSLTKLVDVTPVLSMAVGRFKEEAKNRIEAVIQEECTTIHPAVKWKFEEEAKKYIYKKDSGEMPQFEDIAFKDVYPLYGQMDIRNSSSKRNEAVVMDMIKQLKDVRSILVEAYANYEMPSFEELVYRINTYMEELEAGLMAGSEFKILGFLRSEIYPIFDHLKKTNTKLASIIDAYLKRLDKDLGIVYEARRAFDDSVTRINQMLASFVDEKQVDAQKMFPHYFERYKTDGVEYNMYIGQSIVRNREFNPIYLRNLRLWQLLMMCEMEQSFKKLQQTLENPLEVASLILVYNSPLSIHFRLDEKKFDVEGAYNARYEIVKKRVDKANIKGTSERITTPGKIAIIYTNDQDKVEYERYVQFLEAKGLVKKNSLEHHELETLQGITGLKALRVEVDDNNIDDINFSASYQELVKAL